MKGSCFFSNLPLITVNSIKYLNSNTKKGEIHYICILTREISEASQILYSEADAESGKSSSDKRKNLILNSVSIFSTGFVFIMFSYFMSGLPGKINVNSSYSAAIGVIFIIGGIIKLIQLKNVKK